MACLKQPTSRMFQICWHGRRSSEVTLEGSEEAYSPHGAILIAQMRKLSWIWRRELPWLSSRQVFKSYFQLTSSLTS